MKGEKNNKRMLMLASVASMIDQFNMNNIETLLDLGYRVDVACNFEKGNTCSIERITALKEKLCGLGVNYYQIDFDRNVMNLPQDMMAYKQIKKLVKKEKYDFIHCHSPIGGVIGRIVAHETKTKVIYTAHGFHFYDGAPKKNWIVYYPIEKHFSRWTDTLITINKEDYKRAKQKLMACKNYYVPGVGIDTKSIAGKYTDYVVKREELGIKADELMLISVGELNDNKNHEVIIRSLAKINDKSIHYCIAGVGNCDTKLRKLAEESNVNLNLLGFRTDVGELLKVADVFVFPSFREGLSVALMEAMAAGLPCVVSNIRGNCDLIDPDRGGYLVDPTDIEGFARRIDVLAIDENKRNEFGEYNKNKIKQFDSEVVNKKMREIYVNCA